MTNKERKPDGLTPEQAEYLPLTETFLMILGGLGVATGLTGIALDKHVVEASIMGVGGVAAFAVGSTSMFIRHHTARQQG